jgi:hypothetical protein
MKEKQLLALLDKGKQLLSVKCKNFSGALVVELLIQAFNERHIPVSRPNVYMVGLPTEIDLVIPRKDAQPEFEILYKPKDILAVLEIKASGLFNKETASKIGDTFKAVQSIEPSIFCAYVTVSERFSYKYKATKEVVGFPVYTIAWHSGPDNNHKYDFTGDFSKLLDLLADMMVKNP